jgi:hypothetical protein
MRRVPVRLRRVGGASPAACDGARGDAHACGAVCERVEASAVVPAVRSEEVTEQTAKSEARAWKPNKSRRRPRPPTTPFICAHTSALVVFLRRLCSRAPRPTQVAGTYVRPSCLCVDSLFEGAV